MVDLDYLILWNTWIWANVCEDIVEDGFVVEDLVFAQTKAGRQRNKNEILKTTFIFHNL